MNFKFVHHDDKLACMFLICNLKPSQIRNGIALTFTLSPCIWRNPLLELVLNNPHDSTCSPIFSKFGCITDIYGFNTQFTLTYFSCLSINMSAGNVFIYDLFLFLKICPHLLLIFKKWIGNKFLQDKISF